jgi:hypothetical protein
LRARIHSHIATNVEAASRIRRGSPPLLDDEGRSGPAALGGVLGPAVEPPPIAPIKPSVGLAVAWPCVATGAGVAAGVAAGVGLGVVRSVGLGVALGADVGVGLGVGFGVGLGVGEGGGETVIVVGTTRLLARTTEVVWEQVAAVPFATPLPFTC